MSKFWDKLADRAADAVFGKSERETRELVEEIRKAQEEANKKQEGR